jgi:hypothetical protein
VTYMTLKKFAEEGWYSSLYIYYEIDLFERRR